MLVRHEISDSSSPRVLTGTRLCFEFVWVKG
jgi:hypothetical protein